MTILDIVLSMNQNSYSFNLNRLSYLQSHAGLHPDDSMIRGSIFALGLEPDSRGLLPPFAADLLGLWHLPGLGSSSQPPLSV